MSCPSSLNRDVDGHFLPVRLAVPRARPFFLPPGPFFHPVSSSFTRCFCLFHGHAPPKRRRICVSNAQISGKRRVVTFFCYCLLTNARPFRNLNVITKSASPTGRNDTKREAAELPFLLSNQGLHLCFFASTIPRLLRNCDLTPLM